MEKFAFYTLWASEHFCISAQTIKAVSLIGTTAAADLDFTSMNWTNNPIQQNFTTRYETYELESLIFNL